MKATDQSYLGEQQYKNSTNLDARIRLHALFSANPQGFHQWLFGHLGLPEQSRILELGCGPAMLWRVNLERIPAGWDITLSDLSPGMLEDAKRKLGDKSALFHFEVADAQAIPFADESFDVVIANHMLYHVPDRQKAFSEVRRVLRSGGRFYASTVGVGHMRELEELLSRIDPDFRPPIGDKLASAFGLGNGGEQLARWFSNVNLHRHEDALVVTEAEPLVAYAQSMIGIDSDNPRWDRFRRLVESEIAQHGAVRITKEVGLFSAVKK